MGAVPHDQSCGQDAYAAGPARQHSHLHPLDGANGGFIFDQAGFRAIAPEVVTPFSISGAGNIAGEGRFAEGTRAFLFKDGQVQNLGALGGLLSRAFGVNDDGHVVGTYTAASDGNEHAFLYTPEGGMQNLRDLVGGAASGWTRLRFAHAINAGGDRSLGKGLSMDSSTRFWLSHPRARPICSLDSFLRSRIRPPDRKIWK